MRRKQPVVFEGSNRERLGNPNSWPGAQLKSDKGTIAPLIATYLSLLILAIIGSSAVVTALVASNRVQGVADMAVLYAHDRAVTNGMPNKNLLVAGVGEFLRSAESAKRLEIVAISAAVESAESSLELCARYQNPLGVGINSAVICRSSRAESFLITGGT